MKMTCRKHAGFTLIEVLVALVIVAVTLAAGLRVAGAGAASTRDYRERLLARWVAANVLERARLERQLPPPGVTQGEEMQGGQMFVWRKTVSNTPNFRFRRLDIEVGPEGAAQATLSGFVMKR